MAFPSQRLFLVLSFDPCPNAALCIDRIELSSQAKDITTLWSCVWPEHLVPGVGAPRGSRVVAAADLAPQDFAQECTSRFDWVPPRLCAGDCVQPHLSVQQLAICCHRKTASWIFGPLSAVQL